MKNPFEYGRELGTDELVDRQAEILAVTQTIRQGGKLFLIGPRRFGKTSILRAAADQLSQQQAVILRFNAENYPSVDQLVAALIAEAARQLKGTVERKGEQARQFFASLRPDLSFDLTESRWKVALGIKLWQPRPRVRHYWSMRCMAWSNWRRRNRKTARSA